MATLNGYTKSEIDRALSTVWHLAERKHQDECMDEVCSYCQALKVVVMVFDDIEQSGRVQAYRQLPDGLL